jgi:hypothetical protein
VETKFGIPIDYAAIAEFCRRNHIKWLSLFGSVLRDDFSEDSDVDVLVEFEEGRGPGYIGLFTMSAELESLFGRKVDLLTPAELSPYFRTTAMQSARRLYDAA